MWSSFEISPLFSIVQVTHESTLRDGRINLEARHEDAIRHGNPWATATRFRVWFLDQIAQPAKQSLEVILLARLRGVVLFPFLWICFSLGRDSHFFRDRFASICVLFSLYYKPHREDVFAALAALLEVWTRAEWSLLVRTDRIFSVSRLARDLPDFSFLLDFADCCDHRPTLFSCFAHGEPRFLAATFVIFCTHIKSNEDGALTDHNLCVHLIK